MTTRQPLWVCVGQLGDADPLENGGYWVFIDLRGNYEPEAEVWIPEERRAYRFTLEPCTYFKGVLSDNPYHPELPAWFADDLPGIASFIGDEPEALRVLFCSPDPLDRAEAWRAVGDFFGWENLDSYPLHLSKKEARRRYARRQYRPKPQGATR